MIDRIRKLRAPKVKALNEIIIESEKILANYALLQSLHPDDGIFPVVKSNAYGHGLKEIVQILKKVDAPYICVDSFPEYQLIKKYGNTKALIIGETFPENYKYYKQEYATVCVYNIETIQYLIKKKRKMTIHLFLNTGMNREGLQMQDLGFVLPLLKGAKHITVEGVMSHFANADELDKTFNQSQIETFKAMTRLVEKELGSMKWKHLGNSAGTGTMTNDFFNGWRTGLSLYGYSPFSTEDSNNSVYDLLQPALTLTSTVIATQQIQKEDGVSYGLYWKTDVPTSVGTIPFGYCEGMMRTWKDKNWPIKIGDEYYPLVGAICMNLSCFHSGDGMVTVGDRVIIIDSDPNAPNTMMRLAHELDTVAYETLVKLSPTIKRIIL